MKITIQNAHVLGLASWLAELELDGIQSRRRSRLVKKLSDQYQENEAFRKNLLEKYSEKDEEGKPKLTEDGQSVVIADKDAFVSELTGLLNDDCVIDEDDKTVEILKDIVLNTKYVFGPKPDDTPEEKNAKIRQANDYNEWCEFFENAA